MKFSSLLIPLVFFSLLSSCSLKYAQQENAEEKNPEFVFERSKFSRYEDGKLKANLTSELMERYKKSSAVYAKQVQFETYDNEEKIENDGSCGLLFADMDKEIFEFYEGVSLFSSVFGGSFTANVLRWNGKNMQLTGSRNDTVYIEKENTSLSGAGFSGSGISRSYLFKNAAEGTVDTDLAQQTQEEVNTNMGGTN